MSAILSVILLALAGTALGQENVLFSQIIHRHGSRSPIVPANASILCPPVGCGVLNSEGENMLNNLGVLIRGRYDTLNASFFPASGYDFTKLYSRSTSVPRTMQSADAFIRGAYAANASSIFPVIFNVPLVDDTVLLSDSFSGLAFYRADNMKKFLDELIPVRQSLFTDAVIETMAAEFSLQGFCAQDLTNCAITMYDPAASFEATGTLSSYPTVAANYANLKQMALAFFKLIYGYDSSSESDQIRGSPGQPTAQAILGNINSYLGGSMPYAFIHYSAHDSTVSPLGVTIGETSDDILLPPYGAMMAFDLLEDGGAYFVRGIKGAPQQTPGPHTYSTAPLQLGGIDSSGRVYYINGTADRMPLADFARFVDSSKPTSSQGGVCGVTTAQLDSQGCLAAGVPTSSLCLTYRTNCMQWACGSDYHLDYANLACLANAATGSSEATMSTANAGVMAMCTTLGGMLMGAGAMFAMNVVQKKRQAAAAYEAIQSHP